MLAVGDVNEFTWTLDSQAGVRPAAAYGATVTADAAANTMGSWVGLVTTPTAYDCWFISININSVSTAAAALLALLDIGVDEAGGTSYTTRIPYLCASNAGAYNNTTTGIWYRFPLHIPAGSTIAARMQCSTGSTTGRVRVILQGNPSRPELVRTCSTVEALGVTAASSTGTTATPGTTSEGAWVSLGSPSKTAWWWQVAYMANDTNQSAAAIHVDLAVGDASNKRIVVADQHTIANTSENCSWTPPANTTGLATPADVVYGRCQTSTTVESNVSLIGYAGIG